MSGNGKVSATEKMTLKYDGREVFMSGEDDAGQEWVVFTDEADDELTAEVEAIHAGVQNTIMDLRAQFADDLRKVQEEFPKLLQGAVVEFFGRRGKQGQ